MTTLSGQDEVNDLGILNHMGHHGGPHAGSGFEDCALLGWLVDRVRNHRRPPTTNGGMRRLVMS